MVGEVGVVLDFISTDSCSYSAKNSKGLRGKINHNVTIKSVLQLIKFNLFLDYGYN